MNVLFPAILAFARQCAGAGLEFPMRRRASRAIEQFQLTDVRRINTFRAQFCRSARPEQGRKFPACRTNMPGRPQIRARAM